MPGCGKSFWASRQPQTVLSSDHFRYLLYDDEAQQTNHRLVFSSIRHVLRKRLELGRPATYIDATNLTPRERRPWVKTAHEHGALAEAVFFHTPIDVCKARNAARSRIVPEFVIDAMAARLIPPSLNEGFTSVTVYEPTGVDSAPTAGSVSPAAHQW